MDKEEEAGNLSEKSLDKSGTKEKDAVPRKTCFKSFNEAIIRMNSVEKDGVPLYIVHCQGMALRKLVHAIYRDFLSCKN